MYDMHSHFLPGVDDGAKTSDISFKMLEADMQAGVTHILSTSHCYPYKNSDIESFLSDRNAAYKKLKEKASERNFILPDIKLASEVHITCVISKFSSLDKLRIQDTRYILIEMPSSPWSEKVIDTVYKLTVMGFKPIIAHMERNQHQKRDLINSLYDLDVLIQINAEAFYIAQLKKTIDEMMKNKLVHLIGSDMHNMENRKPNIDRAAKMIKKRYGNECLAYLNSNACAVWNDEEIRYSSMRSFKKKGLFGL